MATQKISETTPFAEAQAGDMIPIWRPGTGRGVITSDQIAALAEAAGGVTEGELSAAIAAHESAANPHPTYLTAAEGNAAYDAIGAAETAKTQAEATAAAALAAHESASNPHPTYLTAAEGSAAYDAIGAAASAQSAAAAALAAHEAAANPHPTYLTAAEGAAAYDAIGAAAAAQSAAQAAAEATAAAALTAHEAASNPHPGYLTPAEGNAAYDAIGAAAAAQSAAQTYADGKVSDAAYSEADWNGVTGVAASKNAVRDKIEALAATIPAAYTDADAQAAVLPAGGTDGQVLKKASATDFDVAWENESGAASIPTPQYVAGRWYCLNQVGEHTQTGATLAADTIYLSPLLLLSEMTLSDLGVRFITSSAGQNLKLAIYANDSAGLPTGAPLAYTGDISTATTSPAGSDIVGDNVTLSPGLYWFAVWSSGTPVLSAIAQANIPLMATHFGSTSLFILLPGAQSFGWSYTFALAYGSFPDLTGQSFGSVGASTAARMYVALGKAA